MIVKSIRGRIQLWHTSLLAILMAGLLTAFYVHEKEIRIREFDNRLMAPITSLIPHFAPNAPTPAGRTAAPQHRPDSHSDRPPPRAHNAQHLGPPRHHQHRTPPTPPNQGHRSSSSSPNETEANRLARQDAAAANLIKRGLYIASLNADGSTYYRSSNAPSHLSPPQVEQLSNDRQSFVRTHNENRECIHLAPSGGCVLIGAPTTDIKAGLAHLRVTLLATGSAIVLFGYGIGWILVGRSLHPIQSISETASQIAAGDLTRRINLNETESELGQLGQILNDTFAQLEGAFEQQVRFTADASHELRTPIAVILAKCQFALMREREPEKYRNALQTCEASAQHIRGLVDSLLELARIDSGEFRIQPSTNDLTATAAHSVSMLTTLAEAKAITLSLHGDPLPAHFDPERIHQVATNLIGNAIKYTQNGGHIQVKVTQHNSIAQLEVRDNGPGIDAQHLPHLFDRFYRTSNERSDDRRSTGLGLAITQAIVTAHHGTINVTSHPGQGSCFTVNLPRPSPSP